MKRITRLLTVFLVTLTLGFYSIPSANAADDEIITIIHTNDMHGRLAQTDKEVEGSRLARLKYYAESVGADLIVDGGDAIQGLPISNLNKGKSMLEAMIQVGYDAMAVGNHEFDFGLENIENLNSQFSERIKILSTNTVKDSKKVFDGSTIKEIDGKKIAIIGVTTPETETKTHPKNIEGVKFLDPLDSVLAEIETLGDDFDLYVVLSHLGVDSETKEEWRGSYLAEKLSEELSDKKFVVIDGHSHTKFPEGNRFGENVLYAQTGDYLSNIGHVSVNLDDFSQSTIKLVDISSIKADDIEKPMLEAELEAENIFKEIGSEVVLENFPFKLEGDGGFVRTREMALGNLVTDAMMAYGKGLSQQPDLAVINGGGLRTDLPQGKVTVGDIIAIMPFGNLYTSAEVKGSDIIEMFEHSYRTDVVDYTDEGYPILDRNGGFLQVSGAKILINTDKEAGNRIEKVLIDTPNGWELIEEDKTYILATNDFLIAGGDGYTSLENSTNRFEGEGLDQVLIEFFREKLDNVDLSLYEEQEQRTRIFPYSIDTETRTLLEEWLIAAEKVESLDIFTDETVEPLRALIEEVKDYLETPELFSKVNDEKMIEKLKAAITDLEKIAGGPIVDKPGEKPVDEKPVDEKPVDEKPVDEKPVDEKPVKDGELPTTGSPSFGLPILGLGIALKAIAKRRE